MGGSSSFGPILEADERYALRERTEIFSVLRALQKSGAALTLCFNQGREFLLTTILAIDPEAERLVLDLGADERANKLLLGAKRVQVIGRQDRIRIEFTAQGVAAARFGGRAAFAMPVPGVRTRLQRRDFYRLDVPLGQRVKALLQPPAGGAPIEAELLDISCGGVAIVDRTEAPPIGSIYPGCTIHLPGVGTVSAALEVCSVADLQLTNGAQARRIGCRFVKPNSAMQTLIQRYVNNVERERARLRR